MEKTIMEQNRQEIFIRAYGDYEKSLLRRSLFKVGDKALADDLVQTTFLKTWEYLVKRGNIDSMKAFLFNVLNNLIVDEYRKEKPVSLDVLSEGGFHVEIDDSEQLFNIIDGKNAIMMIPLLSEKYRKVITMRYLEDLPLKDIALATNQSKNTVAVQIHRGVEKLAILFRLETTEFEKQESGRQKEKVEVT